MSHLGDLLSALVDGELDGAERDRTSAHLARCEQCRVEAAALRELKRQLGELAEAPGEAVMPRRLLAISAGDAAAAAGPGIPASAAAGLVRRHRVLPRPARSGRGRAGASGPGGASGPRGVSGPGGPRRLRITKLRRRYLVLGTVTIMVGLGTAAFSVGGGDPAPGPRIVPQVELYSEEHAITTGGVPFGGPGPAIGPGAASTAARSADTADTASSAAQKP